MFRHAILAMDRTLWPFTIEYCCAQKRLNTKATAEYAKKMRKTLACLRENEISIHLTSTCSNKKIAKMLLEIHYNETDFDSVIFDTSQHKLRHLEKVFPDKNNHFLFVDSNITTLHKIGRHYKNAIVCHSSSLHDIHKIIPFPKE